MTARDRLAAALAGLDPESRALLELFARRGLSDEDIAGILGMEASEITRRRDVALARLAESSNDAAQDRDELSLELRRMPDDLWRVKSPPRPAREPRRQWPKVGPGPLVVGLLLMACAAVALVLVLSTAADEPERPASAGGQDPTPRPESAPRTEPRPARRARRTGQPAALPLTRLNGTRGRGVAQLDARGPGGPKLRLSARGFLPPRGGGYAVWLYSSPSDARRLYSTTQTAFDRDLPLPRDFARYRYVEVARAIPELGSGHSGLSLLRVPTLSLRKARRAR